ncbi:peptidylprolyl isomerase [Polaribacter reichenbachii]|uniref:Peptidyl-prolyl cis-trans isomerase n=1 Tax=Polaribacter reichenbachii TaxID=996801 RepID=A0A1B8TW72_9FLAO|nr:FKBP-type peptidyl-prolyl cis-trans isomerase [Polaribacter reichenbachii]APZ45141.1 peptidylprolyl isomerase [Polaribacter reichenbachii]AUC19003.1 peptidylprolyl isomerase [Polaribacter reichenbachii]OBY63840.1 peptidylprolyl isomerase [Polaribacter reichenbachii]
MKSYLSTLIIVLAFSSCLNSETPIEEPIDYDALNEIEIQDYITENNLNPEKSDSGLYYILKEEGVGVSPTTTSNVTVYYKGYTTDGVVFDESTADGTNFNLNGLITGFSEGITYLKEGGEATLIIPSKIGYPYYVYSSFAGKVVIFDVKLLTIN